MDQRKSYIHLMKSESYSLLREFKNKKIEGRGWLPSFEFAVLLFFSFSAPKTPKQKRYATASSPRGPKVALICLSLEFM